MAQKTPVGVLPNARFRLFFDVMKKGGLGSFFGGYSKSYPHSVVLLPAIMVKYRTLSNAFFLLIGLIRCFYVVPFVASTPINLHPIRRVFATMVSLKLTGH